MSEYDPFARGPFPVGVRTTEALDGGRSRRFPCEIWYPAAAQHAGQDLVADSQDVFTTTDPFARFTQQPSAGAERHQLAVRNATPESGIYPLIVFSHSSGGDRRQSTSLCTHLSSHGYVVAALDHSELVAPELAPRPGETAEQRTARADALIANRVPDVRLLIDHMLQTDCAIDPNRIGIVGHSFGGWTALAAPEVEARIRAVVALAPGGGARPKPGILPAKLTFKWGRDVPTLYIVAENDTSLPLDGMYELFERTDSTKQMFILRRADHAHFMDDGDRLHEAFRNFPLSGDLAAIQKEMRPMTELCSIAQALLLVRGLALCHMDAKLKGLEHAEHYWTGLRDKHDGRLPESDLLPVRI
jgi:dienelactone hydrolase